MKKRLLAGTTLALAAGSLAAGCGGGDDTTTVSGASGATGAQGAPLTKDAFLAKANAICKQGEAAAGSGRADSSSRASG